ncbi:E3 ubiquitin-protein ligase TRIM33-like [Mercenaria mercenaria]|uniref:E3 ubiquitin-protein ligase TRIM33-like n=1 Tax=Mercenaria mercenaria TaxID=6596 RepID=UPI00234F4F52|nr:E3 ubiquitin-protein ligase TRIM33-like [Mercenaria mercenaria]
MATGGCEITSDEIFNFKCTPCSKKNKNREAVKYCVECQGYCCRSCVDIHEDFPALEGHQLLDKSDFKSTGITSDLPDLPTVRCKIHTVKVMDMYCGNHDVVGCTSCMALSHRSCTDVQLVPDIINTVFKKEDADDTSLKLQDKIKQLEKIIQTRLSLLKELKGSKAEAITAITDFIKELEVILQNLKKKSLNEVEEEYHKTKSMLEEEKKKAETEMKDMKQADNDIRQLEVNKTQTFVNTKIAQEKATIADEVIMSLKSPSNTKIKFQVDTDIRDTLRRLKSLGELYISSSTAFKPRASVYSITGTSDMNIKLPYERNTCHIVGSCLTETGMLLLTDYNNRKLKRTYVTNLSAIDYCEFSDIPHFVCATNKQEAAVTFNHKAIQFVSIGKQMARTRQLTVGHRCYGIAYNEDKLYITDNSSSLYIHDMTGNLLQTVSKDSAGNPLFTKSRDIAFSDNKDKMFVVDFTNKMRTLDIHGNHTDTYTDSDLVYDSGVDTDRRGNIFVCGYGSNNIVQIGQDGKKKGVIATASDGLVNPFTICFDPTQSVLFVTQRNNNKMKIFNLK